MSQVLSDLEETCKIIQEYFAILGPDLIAVTGSKDLIDEKIDKVTQEYKKIEDFKRDIYDVANEDAWNNTFKNFEQ